MRNPFSAFALAILIGLSPTVLADAPQVYCQCTQGDYFGPGHYAYAVDSASYPMLEFAVGTSDLDAARYTNVAVPSGWNFAVELGGVNHSCGLVAFHGFISVAPCDSLTEGVVRWWTEDPVYAIESFTFAFDHPWLAEDVGWALHTRRAGPPPVDDWFNEFWDSPVGLGTGPLHGPWTAPTWCWSHDDCEPDHYCFFAQCAAETGVCIPGPGDLCPDLWDPVCGCDGLTYTNACSAAVAGVSLAYSAPCLTGDLDLDADVDLSDLAALLSAFGTCAGDPDYFPAADLDNNGCIELADLALLLANYGIGT